MLNSTIQYHESFHLRNALLWISLGMVMFGLFTLVSLLTGPIIAGWIYFGITVHNQHTSQFVTCR